MTREEYTKKLKDPRWQKKRLEVFNRDGFTCRACDSNEKTLHVHHLIYRPKVEPWEAPLHELVTLCEECHAWETSQEKNTNKCLIYALRTFPLFDHDLMALAAAFNVFAEPEDNPDYVDIDKHLFGYRAALRAGRRVNPNVLKLLKCTVENLEKGA
jgi:hypothetical protein